MKMNKQHKRKKKQRGQVMIEFIFVFTIVLTLIFVFVQLAWATAWGHYAHYATFMSARAYLSSASSKLKQVENAVTVLNKMVKRAEGDADLLEFVAKSSSGDNRDITACPEDVKGACIGTHPQFNTAPRSRAYSWAEGVQYNYGVKMYVMPLADWVKKDKGKTYTVGTGDEKSTPISFSGSIPFASDAFLGRETSHAECLEDMQRLSIGFPRGDGQPFIEDNGC
jgi:uncharacterized protein (UPF0333 family)